MVAVEREVHHRVARVSERRARRNVAAGRSVDRGLLLLAELVEFSGATAGARRVVEARLDLPDSPALGSFSRSVAAALRPRDEDPDLENDLGAVPRRSRVARLHRHPTRRHVRARAGIRAQLLPVRAPYRFGDRRHGWCDDSVRCQRCEVLRGVAGADPRSAPIDRFRVQEPLERGADSLLHRGVRGPVLGGPQSPGLHRGVRRVRSPRRLAPRDSVCKQPRFSASRHGEVQRDRGEPRRRSCILRAARSRARRWLSLRGHGSRLELERPHGICLAIHVPGTSLAPLFTFLILIDYCETGYLPLRGLVSRRFANFALRRLREVAAIFEAVARLVHAKIKHTPLKPRAFFETDRC